MNWFDSITWAEAIGYGTLIGLLINSMRLDVELRKIRKRLFALEGKDQK